MIADWLSPDLACQRSATQLRRGRRSEDSILQNKQTTMKYDWVGYLWVSELEAARPQVTSSAALNLIR